jgi:hypothetical protein
MTDVERLLTAELADLGEAAPHDPDLAGAVRRRARRQAAVLGSALAVLVLVAGVGLAAAGLRDDPAPLPAAGPPPAAVTCAPLRPAVLPEWARTGFSEAEPRMPFATTDSGRMVAIVFAAPLTAPPRPDVANKVLWVLRDMPYQAPGGSGTFYADARLAGSDRTARVAIGSAPGPSYVDLPVAGCWELTLHWGTYTDTVRLAYAPRR